MKRPTTQCDLGLVAFNFNKDHPFIKPLEGHGVHVIGEHIDNICGSLDAPTETLIWGSGGSRVSERDKIMHTAEFCAEGLYQASR